MTIKIEKKIRGYAVVSPTETQEAQAPALQGVEIIQMHEKIERPDTLVGSTYKIKSPALDHAMYVTINDIVLNEGNEHEHRRPFEIFINSKAMDQFQWIVALTRIMSAVFRKGGDITFLVEEMKAVFDPKGGYFKPGGVYMPSLVAEIGSIVEQHLTSIGMLRKPELSEGAKQLIAAKRAQAEGKPAVEDVSSFPPGATMCTKCSTKALVILDGCATCLNCGYSKCG
jgi:hypothetical protein